MVTGNKFVQIKELDNATKGGDVTNIEDLQSVIGRYIKNSFYDDANSINNIAVNGHIHSRNETNGINSESSQKILPTRLL